MTWWQLAGIVLVFATLFYKSLLPGELASPKAFLPLLLPRLLGHVQSDRFQGAPRTPTRSEAKVAALPASAIEGAFREGGPAASVRHQQ